MQLSGDIRIERPIDEVFAAWSALERSSEYSDAIVERRQLTEGPVGTGTRYHAVDKWPGREVEFTVEVTRFDAPRQMSATWSEPVTGTWEAAFEESGAGTVLRFSSTIEPSGLTGLLSPLLRPWASRQLKSFLADFRTWVEADRHTPDPAESADPGVAGSG